MGEYESYQSTSYRWLPKVPSHWLKKSIRQITSVLSERCGDRDYRLLSVYREYGVIPKDSRDDNHNKESLDLSNYKVVHIGDLVLNKMKMWQGSLGVSQYEGIVSPAYIICKVLDKDINLDYLHLLLRSARFKSYYNQYSYGIRVGQWDMHYEDFKNLKVYMPPRAEQDQIVRFLDWKVSEINKLIGIRKKEIQELEELFLKVTDIYVTHGIRRSAQYQITGIDWAPEIPENWSLSKIRHHFEIKKRIAGSDGYDVFSVTQKGLKVRNIHLYEGQLAADYSGYQFVQAGEFAMNHMDLLTGGIGIADHLGVTSPDYRVFRLFDVEHCYAPYFLYVFQLCYRRHAFYRFGHGAANVGRWRLPADAFLNFEIPLPPYGEQVEIVQQIDNVQKKIDFEVEDLRKQIEDLEELKSVIVSDVVTGKVDVRNITVPEYEHVDDIVDDDSENNEETETDGEEA